MKIMPQNIKKIDTSNSTYKCLMDNTQINVSFVAQNIISIEYSINSYKTPEYLTKATDYLENNVCLEPVCSKKVDDNNKVILSSGNTEVIIDKGFGNVEIRRDGNLIHGGVLGTKDTVISHSQFRLLGNEGCEFGRFSFPLGQDDEFYGLGDKGGKPDRRGTRLRMFNRDSLGFDAEKSDPLYKSIPFFIRRNKKQNAILGLYFPESCIDGFDFGRESIFFYSVDIIGGPFKYYVILGDNYKEIINGYCKITGFPTLPPLFSFGYLGSSMNYVEAYDAPQRIEKFFAETEKYDLPCEGLYVSSGYLKADDGSRYSFFWNRRKFPDPSTYISNLEKRGYHLTFNIKPGILTTHPWYEELKAKEYFVKDNSGKPIVEFFWGGNASFIDFNNKDAVNWWRTKLCEAYLDFGAEGIWNDNNECEIEDTSLDSFKIRTVYPVKMAQVSYELCLEKNPTKRPWIYTRSAYSGIQKYSRTWTGDNTSTFKTLKYNQYQGLSLGISGVPYIGHDLGGFFGDEPSDELLIRACQSAVFQPRFVIHSWRENDEPTEPWRNDVCLKNIRQTIEDHYTHMPYIYNVANEAALTGIPMERPLFLEYPNENIPTDIEQSLFGSSVLKTPILNEGQSKLNVLFPNGNDWYCPMDNKLYNGGTTQTFDVPLDSYYYFYKTGSVIPTTKTVSKLRTGFFNELNFRIIPANGTTTYDYFEDDGISVLSMNSYNLWRITVDYNQNNQLGKVSIECKKLGNKDSLSNRSIEFSFPKGFIGNTSISVDQASKGFSFEFSGCF